MAEEIETLSRKNFPKNGSYSEMEAVDLTECVLLRLVHRHASEFDQVEYEPQFNSFEIIIPSMTLRDYVLRVWHHSLSILNGPGGENVPSMVAQIAYLLDFVGYASRGFYRTTSTSVYKLYAISSLVCCKCWFDVPYSNSYMSTVFGIKVPVLQMLELEFLKMICFAVPSSVDVKYLSDAFNVHFV